MAANPDFKDLDAVDYSKYRHCICRRPDPSLPGLLEVHLDGKGTRFNAMVGRMHRECSQIWNDISRDPTVAVVVVTAEAPGFSAGGALEEKSGKGRDPNAPRPDPAEARFAAYDETRNIVKNMIDCNKVIISAINGVAVGAGLAVALMPDITIAAENARLLDGHTKLGVAAGDHAVAIWPLLCGMAKAKYYILTGEAIGAKEAERIGLVSKCVPEGKAEEEAMRIGRELAAGPQHALKHTKRALNTWLQQSGMPAFDFSCALEMLDFQHDDSKDGGKFFAEKKPWPLSQFTSSKSVPSKL